MKKVLVYGWFGENNLGDELLLKTMLNMISSNLSLEAYVIGSKPKEIKKNHITVKIASAAISLSFKKMLRALVKSPVSLIKCLLFCEILIIAGGGAISDWNPESTKEMFFLINWFAKRNKKIYLLGVGAGPIKNKKSEKIFFKVLNKATLITVRDKNSYLELKKIKLKNILLSNDLVIYSSIYNKKTKMVKKINKIGLVLVPVCQNTKQVYNKLLLELNLLIKILSYKYEVSLIPFQYDYDKKFINELNFNKAKVNILYSNNIWNTISYIERQDVIIGMRYHSLILAIELKKYLLPIVYHSKSAELCKEFDLLKYTSYVGNGENWEKSNINALDIIRKLELIQTDKDYMKRIKTKMENKRNNNIEKEIINRL